MDNIEEIFAMQRELMEVVPSGIPPHVQEQVTCGLGVIEETLEYLNAIGRKPWRPHPLPEEKQLEELVDILHFFIELIIRSGFSWEHLIQGYKVKQAENLERYRRASVGDFSWDQRGKGEL